MNWCYNEGAVFFQCSGLRLSFLLQDYKACLRNAFDKVKRITKKYAVVKTQEHVMLTAMFLIS